jgi:glutamate/tyrosine decarboxylase-like PLP-dependent enzyme
MTKKDINTPLSHDGMHMASLLEETKQLCLEYLAELDRLPVGRPEPEVKKMSLPEQGLGAFEAITLFREHFMQHMMASSGGRYFGYVTGGTTPAAIMGDWLTSVFDQNTQNINGFGDASALLELEVMRMLLDLFGLPQDFLGGMVSGATMSNFSSLGVARQWIGKEYGKDIAREGMISNIRVYAAVPHSSALKALSMLGFGSKNIILVSCLPDRESMDMQKFEELISQHPEEPFILISSGGTVNTVDFDEMQAIAGLKKKYGFWWHIDAAFGAFAACSPEYRHLLQGWEKADSITVDCHKWLNVPYDSAVFFVRKEHHLLQIETFQNSNAPYLGDPMENFSYLNLLPENSRRFRALPVWFTLHAYGKQGYQDIVENCINLAQQLGEWIHASVHYTLVAPVRLNVVCFTLRDAHEREAKIHQMAQLLNERGKVFMTISKYQGKSCLRAALVNWRTQEKDIEIAMQELEDIWALLH